MFPTNPEIGDVYTSPTGTTFSFNEKGAWIILSGNGQLIKFTVSPVAPEQPDLGDQWWDTTTSILKSWATSGDEFFWTKIGGINKNAPIVSDTPPEGPEIGDAWYYQGNLYIYLNIAGTKDWVPVAAYVDVNRAIPLGMEYIEEKLNYELFGKNGDYTFRKFDPVAILQTDNGDDTIKVQDAANIQSDTDYVIVDSTGQTLATITVLNIVGAQTIRAKNTLNFSSGPNDGYKLTKTSFDLSIPNQAIVKNGSIMLTRPLTALKNRTGYLYIRRTAAGVGSFKVEYRVRGTTTFLNAPFDRSEPVIDDASKRDDVFRILNSGVLELRITFGQAPDGATDTVYSMVLGTAPQSFENNRVAKPSNVAPANGAANVSATPTLTGSDYKSLYNIAQGGAEFKVAEDNGMNNLVYSSSTNFLAGWVAVAGQSAAFNDGIIYNGDDVVLVSDGGIVRKSTDGGKTYTAGATSITQNMYGIAHNRQGRTFIVGAAATLLYSDNYGGTLIPVTAPDAFAGDLNGVAALNAIAIAVGATGKIIRTTNTGTIWTTVATAAGYTGTFYDVAMNSIGQCVAVGANGEIQTSSNYGVDWVHRQAPGGYAGTYRSVAIDDAGVAIAVGTNGAIHKSYDFGATWVAKTIATLGYSGTFYGVTIDQNYAMVVGATGEVETSADKGDTWTKRPLAGGSTIQANVALSNVDLKVGLIAGESGLVQTSIRLDGAVTSITLPAGSDLLKINMVYWWSVRYQDAVGYWSEWSEPTAFATQSNFSYVNQPTNTGPANEATNIQSTPTVQASAFAPVGDPDTHATSRWQFSTKSDFSTIAYDSGEVADKTLFTVPNSAALTTGQKYYWRVRYTGASGRTSPWSTPTAFTVVAKPNTPTVTVPAANAVNVSRTPNLQTSSYSIPGGSPAHVASQYQISTTPGFTGIVYDSGSTSNLLSNTVPLASQLQVGTVYYLRVRHQGNGTQWSDWSPTRQFTTIQAGQEPNIDAFNNAKASPVVNRIGLNATNTTFSFNIDPSNFVAVGGDSISSSTVQLATDSGFTNILATINLPNKDQNSLISFGVNTYPTLINYRRLYARVQHVGVLSGPTGYGSGIAVAVESPVGEAVFTSPGAYNWTAPAGVTSVCVVCIGGGGANFGRSAGGGGALGWKNNITVIPGNQYTVIVGTGEASGTKSSSFAGVVTANGGGRGTAQAAGGGGAGGSPSGHDGGGVGGAGGAGYGYVAGGGGGAGGYSGTGGVGSAYISGNLGVGGGRESYVRSSAGAGSGGGGGGGGSELDDGTIVAGGGGGVGVGGAGANGAAGNNTGSGNTLNGGYPGSGGGTRTRGGGGSYGGGAGGNDDGATLAGGGGAVRIIWGSDRSFPNNAA